MLNCARTPTNYRHILKARLDDSIRRNPRYSLRAMAKSVGIPPSHLSNILNGKSNLSPASASRVARKLGFRPSEKELFLLMVQFESEKDHDFKSEIQERLLELQPEPDPIQPGLDMFQAISEWHHLAILELTQLQGFRDLQPATDRQYAKWVSRRLGISTDDASAAIDRLVRLRFLERHASGRLSRAIGQVRFASEHANEALRSYHRQMLAKASDSLQAQSPLEKYVGSQTFAFDPSQLDDVKAASRRFLASMMKIASKGKNRTEIYHVGVQAFRITETP